MNEPAKHTTVAIIGGGPAGVSAAIQLKRSGIDFLLFEKEKIGGLLKNANFVENYPGFPRGITGKKLIKLMREHLDWIDIDVNFEKVTNLSYSNDKFFIKTEKSRYLSDFCIIASGTKANAIPTLEIKDMFADRVFYEVYSLSEVKDRTISIVGTGDAAFDYALNLSQNNDVIILNRTDRTRCLPLLKQRCSQKSNIAYKEYITVEKISLTGGRLLLNCMFFNEQSEIKADYLLIAVGRSPALDFIDDSVMNRGKALEKSGKLYYAGDVRNELYRQASIAIGNGIKSAMKIHSKLKEKANENKS
ncbi:NAD(P)/FAD-dependent oxidoreductase [bacterium]|nr:NAD(P)/FAD-dependent oxidoreductase [bacterium]